MQTDRIQPEKRSIFFGEGQKRSLSYNDLKKKRLLRSQKSKSKLKAETHEQLITKTQKKKPPQHLLIAISTTSNTPQDSKKASRHINQAKDVFIEMKQKVQTKKYIISKPSYTDRYFDNNKKSIQEFSNFYKDDKKNSFLSNLQMAGNDKQLIRQIISKKKSQRRLLKFDQIRAQLKRSKSKSKQKSRINSNGEETAANSKVDKSISLSNVQRQKSKKNVRVNKFQTVRQMGSNEPFQSCRTESMNKYISIGASNSNKENSQLKLMSQYQSRRKLKVQDFKTQRRLQNSQKSGSFIKMKFHRKLRKSNSEIVIKTKSILAGRIQNQQKLRSNPSTMIVSESIKLDDDVSVKKDYSHYDRKAQIEEKQCLTQKEQTDVAKQKFKNKQQLRYQKDMQLLDINISSIDIHKQESISLDMENQLNIVQSIQDQELQISMKKTEFRQIPNEQVGIFKKSFFQPTQKQKQSQKKNSAQKHASSNKKRLAQNNQNIQNLSNILDLVALPTNELKIRINRCSKIGKKKNELQKFKKIFPLNFFHNQ